jgi:hypothetical protein
MTQPEQANPPQRREGVQLGAKKPYVKPGFRYEKAFETMALSCGKVETHQSGCKSNKKNS